MTGTMLPRPYAVTQTRQDTRDTHTLLLEPLDGEPLGFAAGQFTMLLAFGVGEVPISISGDPGRPEVLQHTIRDVGAVSRALAHAEPGTVLGVRGPLGTGWAVLDGRGGDVVFLAGGIGLAPLRPALLDVVAHRREFGRVWVLYGARTPEELLFGEDLVAWGRDHDIAVLTTVDAAGPEWTGRVGLVTRLLDLVDLDAARTLALACGPEVMMRHCAEGLLDRGVPAGRIRLSMERSMKCGVGLCGHCQLREHLLCVDGPVLTYDRLAPLMRIREL